MVRPGTFLSGSAGLALAIAAIAVDIPQAQAGFISSVPAAADYTVLYEGTGGHNLSISNVTINGNVGVGGAGVVQFSGPGTISGRVDFSAATNTGQFHNSNGSNVGPSSVNFNVSAVTTALGQINSLSTTLGAESGTNIALSGNTVINAASGVLDTNGNRVFNVTSYNEGNGNVVTINGDLAGDSVVLNFAFASNVNLGGDVTLAGLTDDQVLWNFTTTGKNISLNNNASSFPLPLAFHGDILAPVDNMSMVNANLDGRFWGGNSGDMQIVSGDTINGPSRKVPEPTSLVLLGAGLGVLAIVRRRHRPV
jgi:choice-of-anchor A domain-containing protein